MSWKHVVRATHRCHLDQNAGAVAWAIIGLLLVVAALLAGFAYARSVAIPVLLAFVLAIVFQPLVDWLGKKGWSRGIAAAVVLLGIIVALVGVVALIAGSVVANWDELSSGLSDATNKIDDYLSNTSLSDTLASEANSSVQSSGTALLQGVGSGAASVVGTAAGGIAGLFLGLWVAFYVLQGGYYAESESESDDAPKKTSKWTELEEFSRSAIRGYSTSQTILGVFNGIVIGLAMLVLGVPGAISVAIVNVVGTYIPYVGAIVGGGLAVLLALASGGPTAALIMLVVVFLAQNTLQNIIEPKITAKYVSLSPLAVLLATSIGGVLAGFVGLLLAVPAAAILSKAVSLIRRVDDPTPAATADAT